MILENSFGQRSKLISFSILSGDLLILNIILYVCCIVCGSTLYADYSFGQLHLISSLVYLLVSRSDSVILHHRKVRAYQIVRNVFRNISLFAAFSFLIFYPRLLKNDLGSFFIFIISLYLCISFYRLILRKMVKMWRRSGKNLKHVVLVGAKYNTLELYKALTEDRSTGYRVHGYFAETPDKEFPDACPFLGRPDNVINWLEQHPDVQQLYCNLPSVQQDLIISIIDYCENHLVHFYSLPNLYNYHHHRVYFSMMGNVPYLSLRNNPLQETENRFLKRTFDLLFSGLFLCTLFPFILLVVSIVTKLTMPGPIFFRQKRNGLNDKEFYCYKFRSMKVNTDSDTLQATENDPRKTKWGNIMRKTSLDEVPQFINVFKGEMSVVGPRPHMLKHTKEYSHLIDRYMVRHFVKPGITGWSQITGFRGETKELKDMEGRIKGDIWYIEHWNFWLDIYIIYKTVANVLHGENKAY